VIDWVSVLFNSFWIVGLSILLADFSYHHWLAGVEGRRLKEQLETLSFQRFFWISFVFVSIGLAGTSARTWETAVWGIFILYSLISAIKTR